MSILVSNVYVGPFYGALMGMRNSFNSWPNSDSLLQNLVKNKFVANLDDAIPNGADPAPLGEKDRGLALTLISAGEPHCKFLRQIPVMMDIRAPLYWWKQMDTYKVGTTVNSTSTMHTLMSAPTTDNDFSFEDCEFDALSRSVANRVCANLNTLIEKYNQSNDPVEKEHLFNAVIQLLPEGYNQERTWSGNFSVLRNIYAQRNHHKLREWRHFCAMLKNLPLSWMITVGLNEGPTYTEIKNGDTSNHSGRYLFGKEVMC